MNVITKSGGNVFHGDAFGYYNDTGMRADPVNGEPRNYATPPYSEAGNAQNGNYILSKDVRQEWGLDLGGFAVKDKVWFFAAYDRVQINQNLQTLDLQNSATFGSEFPRSFVQNKYAGKLTLNLSQGTSVVGTVFSDSETQLGALRTPTSLNPLTYAGRQDVGGPDYGARLNQLFGSVGIFTFQYAQHQDRYHQIPDGYLRPAVYDCTISPTRSLLHVGYRAGQSGLSSPDSVPSSGRLETTNRSARPTPGPSPHTSGITRSRRAATSRTTIRSARPTTPAGASSSWIAARGRDRHTPATRPRHRTTRIVSRNYCPTANRIPSTTTARSSSTISCSPPEPRATITPPPASPFNTPTRRYSAFLQDQWRVIPSLTVNLGLRWDTESFYGLDPITGPFKAFSLTNQWSPRVGFTWDWAGDGTSKLYGSWGYFYYALPTDLNVRVYTANSTVITYNYDFFSIAQDDTAPRQQLFQGGSASGEPIDPGTKASYQQEITIGVEKAIDPTLSVGLKGTYRSLMRTVEDRCDLNSNVGPDCPNCAPSSCALQNPGATTPSASGFYPTCNGSGNPTDPTAGAVHDRDRRRALRSALPGATSAASRWSRANSSPTALGAGLGSVLFAPRQLLRRHPRGLGPDGPRNQRRLRLLPVHFQRLRQPRAGSAVAGPDRRGLQRVVRSVGRSRVLRPQRPADLPSWGGSTIAYPGPALPGTPVARIGRTPTDYEMNLSLAYNANIGSVTITPMLYVFNVLNRQTVQALDSTFNPNGTLVTNRTEPLLRSGGGGSRNGRLPGGRGRHPARTTRITGKRHHRT